MASPSTETSPRSIEEAALRAWPAAQQLLFDGWVARLSDGYTKRANSALLLYPQPDSASPTTLERIEALYRVRRLPAIFRLLSFSHAPSVEDWLLSRGYREADGTLVMTYSIDAGRPVDSALVSMDMKTGIEAHARMNGLPDAILPGHTRILERIPGGLSFAGLVIEDELVACGLSVRDGNLVGLFDIVTDPAHRRKGYGARLVNGMLAQASVERATTAYLQVVMANAPAIALYERLGFGVAYSYAYRILD